MYNNPYNANDGTTQEIKGIDLVRRDWCPLSKEVGNYFLQKILSQRDVEEIEAELRDYL